jgi:hypothetical protein
MATASDPTPEEAVRLYLTFLENPDSLRDDEQVNQLEKKLSTVSDPLERLKTFAAIERAKTVDSETLQRNFVQHAKTWADENDVPPAAFKQARVPDDLLRQAGLVSDKRRSGAASGAGASRPRARAVTIAQVKEHVLGRQGTFLLADVMREAGGSQATVRKAIDELIKSGDLEKLGPVPDYTGRGRAPLQYVLKSP